MSFPSIFEISNEGLKILSISWNTQAMNNPNISEWIVGRIRSYTPDLVSIGYQEDVKPGSSFHSSTLPAVMMMMGYILIKRGRMMGIGSTSFKNGKCRGLRLSVYGIKNVAISIVNYEYESIYRCNMIPIPKYDLYYQNFVQQISTVHNIDRYEFESYYSSIWKNKGAIAIYLTFRYCQKVHTLLFINVHLPFNSSRLLSIYSPPIEQDIMFNEIYNYFILFKNRYGEAVEHNINRPRPSHVILMGDLNYRVHPTDNITVLDMIDKLRDSKYRRQMYLEMDELLHEMNRKVIPYMDEGVDGPYTFMPTCKRSKPRSSLKLKQIGETIYQSSYAGYKPGHLQQRYPSWCDRILHIGLTCILYDSFYIPDIMDQSDHDGVYSIHKLHEDIMPN